MQWLSRLCVKRPASLLVVTIFLVAMGLFSITKMTKETLPNIAFPALYITTDYKGASAKIVNDKIAVPIENAIRGIPGVKNYATYVHPSHCYTNIEFDYRTPILEATENVRSALNRISLPNDASQPVISQVNLNNEPSLIASLTKDSSIGVDKFYAFVKNQVVPKVQNQLGIGRVEVKGLKENTIVVTPNLDKLTSFGLTLNDLHRALNLSQIEMPVGVLNDGSSQRNLMFSASLHNIDEIATTQITTPSGQTLSLNQVATVQYQSDGDDQTINLLDHNPTVLLFVYKQQGANDIKVRQTIDRTLQDIQNNSPQTLTYSIVADISNMTRDSLNGIRNDIILAVILTSLVMFIFLRSFRATLVALCSIPVSILVSLMCLRWLNQTLNMMTTMALSLSIGMVVDATIVVIDNIYQNLEQTADPEQAVLDSIGQVGSSVLAGSTTTIAVYLPIAVMSGMVGLFFRPFGLTISLTIFFSLLVSFTLTPFLGTKLLRKPKNNRVTRGLAAFENGLTRSYSWLLRKALNHKLITLLIALGSFAFGLWLVPKVGTEMQPEVDVGFVQFFVPIETGASRTRRLELMNLLTTTMLKEPFVKHVYAESGANYKSSVLLLATLDDQGTRPGPNECAGIISKHIEPYYNFSINDREDHRNSEDANKFYFSLIGENLNSLEEVAKQLIDLVNSTSTTGLSNLRKSNQSYAPADNTLMFNRKIAEALHINLNEVASNLYSAYQDSQLFTLKAGDQDVDVVMRLSKDQRSSYNTLDSIMVHGTDGLIPVTSVVKPTETSSTTFISRYNGKTSLGLKVDYDKKLSSGQVIQILQQFFKSLPESDSSVSLSFSGQNQYLDETFSTLTEVLIIAITLVFIVMVLQFESAIQPFIILFSIPLLTSGAIGGLYLTKLRLSIISVIGIIMLVGIVVNNAIILVDFANQARKDGLSAFDAMMWSAPRRLRPILMTTVTTIVGALPVALTLGRGDEFRQPMAVATVGGLFTSTLLTLFVIPVIYCLISRSSAKVKRKFKIGRLLNKNTARKGSVK